MEKANLWDNQKRDCRTAKILYDIRQKYTEIYLLQSAT
jgi:hypothetical protein